MGTSAGPSLQGIGRGGASNLILEMDAHDAKSYPGEPTSNLLDSPIVTWTDNAAVTATSNVSYGGQTFTRKCVNTATGASSPGLFPVGIQMTVSASTVYTFSLRGFKDVTTGGGNVYLYVQNYTGSWGDMLWPGAAFPNEDEYFADPSNEIVSSTFTTPVSTTKIRVGILFAGMSTTGGIFYVKDLQVEEKGYATPFVREGNGGTGTYNARPASVNLMIHGNVGTGTSFSDSSPSKHTITTVGNTTHSATKSKFSGGSIYFDGTGDKLSVADHADWHFGSGDFTVDMWINGSSFTNSAYPALFSQYIDDNNFLALYFGTSGTRMYLWGRNAGSAYSTLEGQVTWSTDTWYHVAVVRNGTTSYLFRDGILIDSVTESWTASDLASPFYVGWWGYGGADYAFNGYIDEFRVTKGTALWTSAFTPPTRRNLSAPVVDRSGSNNGGNLNTTETTDVVTYRVGEVIRPIDSAVWDYDGTDDKISIVTDSVDVYCFTIAIQQDKEYTPDLVPGQSNVGFVMGGNTFNGIIMGSWTGSMTDETLSWWGYASTPSTGSSATYIRDTITAGWHIFTFNWNGSDYDIWVDGDKKTTYARGEGSGHSGLFVGVTAITPGWTGSGWDGYFEGKMGFFRGYDKSLTDQQVVENFNQQRSRFGV